MENIIKEIMGDLNPHSQDRKKRLSDVIHRIEIMEAELEREGVNAENHRAALLSCNETKELSPESIYRLANSGRLFTPKGMMEKTTYHVRTVYYTKQIADLNHGIQLMSNQRYAQKEALASTAGIIRDQLKQAIAKTEDDLLTLGSRRGDMQHLLMHHYTLVPIDFDAYYAKLRCLFNNLEKLYERRHRICVDYYERRPTAIHVLLAQQYMEIPLEQPEEQPSEQPEGQQAESKGDHQQPHNPVEAPPPPPEQ